MYYNGKMFKIAAVSAILFAFSSQAYAYKMWQGSNGTWYNTCGDGTTHTYGEYPANHAKATRDCAKYGGMVVNDGNNQNSTGKPTAPVAGQPTAPVAGQKGAAPSSISPSTPNK